MSILFQSYELDFSDCLQRINKAFREFNHSRQKEREDTLLQIDKLVAQLKTSVKQMEQE